MAARAERVNQHAAPDAAAHGPREGFDHPPRRAVGGEDVEDQVDVVIGRVDVAHEAVDDAVVVNQRLDGGCHQDRHVTEVLGQPYGRRQLGTQFGVDDVGKPLEPLPHGGERQGELDQAATPPAGEPTIPEQEEKARDLPTAR